MTRTSNLFFSFSVVVLTRGSNARWFRLHSFISGFRLLRGAHPKIRAVIFGHLHIIAAGVQLWSLSFHVSSPIITFFSVLSRVYSLDGFSI